MTLVLHLTAKQQEVLREALDQFIQNAEQCVENSDAPNEKLKEQIVTAEVIQNLLEEEFISRVIPLPGFTSR